MAARPRSVWFGRADVTLRSFLSQNSWCLSSSPAVAPAVVTVGDSLLVRFFDNTGKVLSGPNVKVAAVRFSSEGETHVLDSGSDAVAAFNDSASATFLAAPFPEEWESSVYNRQLVKIEILFGDQKKKVLYARYKRNVHLYTTSGFWVPVGLFGSNLQKTSAGLIFSAQPVNLGWGVKWHIGDGKFYLGASAIAGWSITNVDKPEESSSETDPSGESNTNNSQDSFTLESGALGLLLDVNSWFYVGASNLFDFRSGHDNPGIVYTIGPGTALLSQAVGN